MQAPEKTTPETCEANEQAKTKLVDEHPSMNSHLGLKEENGTTGDLIKSETGLEEDRKKVLPSETVNIEEKPHDTDSSEIVSEIQEPCNEKFNAGDPCLSDSKDISQKSLDNKIESPEAILKREFDIGDVGKVCKVIAGSSSEGVEAMELDVENDTFGAACSEKSAQIDTSVDVATEDDNKKGEFEAVTTEVDAEGTATEGFNSALSLCDNATPVGKGVKSEHSGGTDLEDSVKPDSGSCEERYKELESCKAAVTAQLKTEIDTTGEKERGTIFSTSTSEEEPIGRRGVRTDSFVCDTLEMNSEEGTVDYKTEANIELNK
ncbi:hypothetical protein STEG23_023753 [Scotinomys teguina]